MMNRLPANKREAVKQICIDQHIRLDLPAE
jgi:hypothetical protein